MNVGEHRRYISLALCVVLAHYVTLFMQKRVGVVEAFRSYHKTRANARVQQ